MQKITKDNILKVRSYLLDLQENIISMINTYDKKEFLRDEWVRKEGGGGITCVLENGETFDKVGVNFSDILGDHLPVAATNLRPELQGRSYQAMGVSVVCHPANPHLPTSHLNVRLFTAYDGDSEPIWWFGGGFDMTPYYGYEEDAIHWHKTARDLCLPYGKEIYDTYKNNCDEFIKKVKYPIIVKAASGGGGKGMRIVTEEDDLNKAINEAKIEAKKSFNDENVYLEKFLT